MAEKRRFISSSVRVGGVFDVVILLALAGSWLGLLGRWHWVLDLFSHFRWQYLGICVLAIGWSLWRKRWSVMGIAVATLILNGWLIGGLALSKGYESGRPGKLLRVVSLNVLTSNSNKKGVLEYLQGANADVIFLMEVDAAWVKALAELKTTHPHCLIGARQDNFGVALFSRVPLKEVHLEVDQESKVPSIEARLIHEGQELVIYGTHTLPPLGPEGTRLRNAQLKRIARHVEKLKAPAMVIGDLNSTPWSEGMRVIREGRRLAYGNSKTAGLPTWSVGSVFALPIDHALCTAPLVIVRRDVGPDVGSDHRAIVVEVGFAEQG